MSKDRIWAALQNGEMRHLRTGRGPGGSYRVRREKFWAWVARQEIQGPTISTSVGGERPAPTTETGDNVAPRDPYRKGHSYAHATAGTPDEPTRNENRAAVWPE